LLSLAVCIEAITFLCPRHELSKVSALVEDERFDAWENVKLVTFEVRIEGGLNMVLFDDLKPFMCENVAKFDAIVGRLLDQPRAIEYASQWDGGAPVCIVSDIFLGFTLVSFRILNRKISSITYTTL
jgi:hypothetical protein